MSKSTQTLYVTGIRYNKLNDDKTESTEPLVDKNGKKYCIVEFSTPDTTYIRNAKGQMAAVKKPQVSVGGYTAWEISNLESLKGKSDFGWGLELGEEVQGHIIKRAVEPYKVGERMVSTASVVSFADTADEQGFELDVQAQFRRKRHTLVGSSQQRIADAENVAANVEKKVEVVAEVDPAAQAAK